MDRTCSTRCSARGCSPAAARLRAVLRLEPDLIPVLDLVECGASSADALGMASRLPPGALAAALVRLELAGYLRSDSTGRYERTTLAVPEPA